MNVWNSLLESFKEASITFSVKNYIFALPQIDQIYPKKQ